MIGIKNIESRTTEDLIEESKSKKTKYFITFLISDAFVVIIQDIKIIPLTPWLNCLTSILCIVALASLYFTVFMRYFPNILKEEYGRENVPVDELYIHSGFWEGFERWANASMVILFNLYHLVSPLL